MSKNELKTYPLPLLPFSLILSLAFGWFIQFTAITFWLVPNVIHNNIFKSVYYIFLCNVIRFLPDAIAFSIQHVLIPYWKIFRFSYSKCFWKVQQTNDERCSQSANSVENLFCLQNATLVHIVRYLLFAWWCIAEFFSCVVFRGM